MTVLWSVMETFDNLQSRQDSACCGAGVSRRLGAVEMNESALVCVSGFPFIGSLRLGQIRIFCQLML